MILEHGLKFHVIGLEKAFWSVDQCNSLIEKYNDKFVPMSFKSLNNFGAADQPENYDCTSNRANVNSMDIPMNELNQLIHEYNDMSYNFALGDNTVQYINKLTPKHDLGWHKDNLEIIETLYTKRPPYRVSVVIVLNNKFEGGATEIFRHTPYKLNTGDALLFCCDMWHRIQKVTEGVKFSFNLWKQGVEWR